MLSIPGLTHPVRDLHLEDVLERTHFVIGRGSKYGRGTSGCKQCHALHPQPTRCQSSAIYSGMQLVLVCHRGG